MKPVLYGPKETNFNTQGLGVLSDAVSCYVEEELNGMYELTMEYPYDGIHFKDIALSCIIKVKPCETGSLQLFRVYKISEPMGGVCTIEAEHISYQLNYIPVEPFTADTAATAFHRIKLYAVHDIPFEFRTDVPTTATLELEEQKNARAILGGSEGSILDIFGGEYEWDNYTVWLRKRRGTVTDIELRYGKNITNLEQEENIANTYTGVCPYWKGEVLVPNDKEKIQQEIRQEQQHLETLDNQISSLEAEISNLEIQWEELQRNKKKKKAKTVRANITNLQKSLNDLKRAKNNSELKISRLQEEYDSIEEVREQVTVILPEKVLQADNWRDFPYQRTKSLDFSNYFEEKPSVDNLRKAAKAWIADNPLGKPSVSLKVSFVALWNTEEYKDVAPLERVRLGDSITVVFDRMNVSQMARIRKYKFDVLMERYESLEIGDRSGTMSSRVVDGNLVVTDTISRKPTASTIRAEVLKAQELIKGGYGGYVVYGTNANGQPEEIYVLDKPTIAEATTVIRIGRNGIGFSKSGFEGPYETAWTIDGTFVADFIATGIIADKVGKSYWDIDNGIFVGKFKSLTIEVSGAEKTVDQIAQEKAESEAASTQRALEDQLRSKIAEVNGDIADINRDIGDMLRELATKLTEDEVRDLANAIADAKAQAKVNDYNDYLDQKQVFNKLTKNGAARGLYTDSSGNLYINADYIATGILSDRSGNFAFNLATGNCWAKNIDIEAKSFSLTGGRLLEAKDSTARSTADAAKTSAATAQNTATAAQSTANTAATNANTALNKFTHENIFNLLTKNGTLQGIFIEGGKLYINAEYLRGTKISGLIIESEITKTDYGTKRKFTTKLQDGDIHFAIDGTNKGYIKATQVVKETEDGVTKTRNYLHILSPGGLWLEAYGDCKIKSDSIYVTSPLGGDKVANMRIDKNSNLCRIANPVAPTSSARQYKHDIEPLTDPELDPHKLYDVEIVQFVYNDDFLEEDDWRYRMRLPGIVADDLFDIYPAACYKAGGEIKGWLFDTLIPPMLSLIQEQHKEIEELKERVSKLEAFMASFSMEKE